MKKFPSYIQLDEKDCGPACIKIILKYYGRNADLEKIAELCETNRSGTTFLGLVQAAEKLDLKTQGVKLTYEALRKQVRLPCIVHWQHRHFVVVYKIANDQVFISDPAHGLIKYDKHEFSQHWTAGKNNVEGIALLLEPGFSFLEEDSSEIIAKKNNLQFLWKYVSRYKQLLIQLLFGLIGVSIIQLTFPFLTQALVDHGIQNQNFNFVFLVLIAQLMLFVGRLSLDVIRNWILMHIGTRLQISLLSDFFMKLMKLPISFFDSKMTGDIMQRVNDQKRIETFLTVSSLNVVFSLFSFVVFGAVLLYYSPIIFLVFLFGSIFFFLWIWFYQKKRKDFDYKLFSHLSQEQSKVLELVQGMQEIKLNNAEREKRWGWEAIQAKIFKIEMKSLSLEQYQTVGASFINELKNILITVMAAKLVMEGHMTLGMMLSVSFIVGQLNGPLLQMIDFMDSGQKANLSLNRLLDIHARRDEESIETDYIAPVNAGDDIVITNVSFKYSGSQKEILKNVNLVIPANKITAIVGPSGSGKTTLVKMLLKIYDPDVGRLSLGNTDLSRISASYWRSQCGIVMQDGYIFNDTIAKNIALGQGSIDKNRLSKAIHLSNVREFIDQLPLGINTMIGSDGVGLSNGQKQRILIARAIYKDPKFIFLDEATSSLDANNERVIMNNLMSFFKDRTVVIIAHRLSTVKNANQIVVIGQNGLLEVGSHLDLINSRGHYYNLVKNQLHLEMIEESPETVMG